MGEYTAACLAGVMSADTALAVVVKRAQLFETVAPGGMLSVMANVEQISDLLDDSELSVAAVNAPALCVVSGPVSALQMFSLRLDSRDIDSRSVPIDVAAHSHMLEPILHEFEQFLNGMVFYPPTRKLISNLTGNWAQPDLITEPRYWVRHLRETVCFADGVSALLADTTPVLLEVGPGAILSNFIQACAMQLPTRVEHQSADLQTLTSMRRDSVIGDDESQMLMSLAALWIRGQCVNWQALQPDNNHAQKIPLPSYAFEHKRHWIEPAAQADRDAFVLPKVKTQAFATTTEAAGASEINTEHQSERWPTRDLSRWFATTDWVVAPLTASTELFPKTVLLLSNAPMVEARTSLDACQRVCKLLKSRLSERGCHVIDVVAGNELKQISGDWVIDVTNEDHYAHLLSALESASNDEPVLSCNSEDPNTIAVVSLLNIDDGKLHNEACACPDHSECGFTPVQRLQALLALCRALDSSGHGCHITLVTSDLQQIGAESILDPGKSVIPGALAVIATEMPELNLATVDVQIPSIESDATRLVRTLVNDLAEQWSAADRFDLQKLSDSAHVNQSSIWIQPVRAVRQGRRFVPQLRALSYQTNDPDVTLHHSWENLLGSAPVCLITGGLGGLGYTLALDLARAGCQQLILLGRTSIPEPDQYSQWMKTHSPDDPITKCIRKLQVLEQLGAKVHWVYADLTDAEHLEASMEHVKQKFGVLDALFHTAGVLDDALVVRCSETQLRSVLAPKVQGTINLDRALAAAQLMPELFVLFSSTSASMGIAGQVAYAAANSFLCGYARYKNTVDGTRALAIAWDRWEEVGMAARHSERSRIDHPLYDAWSRGKKTTCVLRPSVARDWYLREHRLADDSAVLPGTGYIALVVAAVELTSIDYRDASCEPDALLSRHSSGVEFQDVVIQSPLVMDMQSQVELQVSLGCVDVNRSKHVVTDTGNSTGDYQVEDNLGEFIVSSLASGAQPSRTTEHVRGFFKVCPLKNRSYDTASIAARCNTMMALQDIFEHAFIDFGERWHCVTAVHCGAEEALVELQLATRYEGDLNIWALHPALLDMALGAASQLLPSVEDHAFIPLGYGRMQVYGPLTSSLRSHVVRRSDDDSAGMHSVSFDVYVVDHKDRLLVAVEKFTLRSIALAGIEQLKPVCSASDAQESDEYSPEVQSGIPVRLLPDLPHGAGIHPYEGLAALRRTLLWQDLSEVVVSPRLTALDMSSHTLNNITGKALDSSKASNSPVPLHQSLTTPEDAAQRPEDSSPANPLTTRSSLSLSTSYAEPHNEVARKYCSHLGAEAGNRWHWYPRQFLRTWWSFPVAHSSSTRHSPTVRAAIGS